LFADGDTAKTLNEGLSDLRQSVEPREQRTALSAVLQAAVQFIADFTRQAGDFSVAGHGLI
jgi:hypothetical protein